METHDITVRVDDYITVIMKMPSELTALELRGIMLKASKITNMSDMDFSGVKRRYTKKFETDSKETIITKVKKHGGYKRIFDEEQLKILKGALRNNTNKQPSEIAKEVSKEIGLTFDQVYDKIHNMRARGQIKWNWK